MGDAIQNVFKQVAEVLSNNRAKSLPFYENTLSKHASTIKNDTPPANPHSRATNTPVLVPQKKNRHLYQKI